MSYSLSTPCYNCAKKDSCTDSKEIQNAIYEIHKKTYEDGHKGSGVVTLSCFKLDALYK
jgi:hypothetical protein